MHSAPERPERGSYGFGSSLLWDFIPEEGVDAGHRFPHRSRSTGCERFVALSLHSDNEGPRRALVVPLGPLRAKRPVQDPIEGEPEGTELNPTNPAVRGLMADFRLLVNVCLREFLTSGVTSRAKISRLARTRAIESRVTGTIGLAAADIARSLAAGHRRRVREGRVPRVPYVRTPFVRVPEESFHFDLETGKLRLSVRPGEWTSLTLPVSNYLRSALNRPDRRVTQVHIGLNRVVFICAQTPARPYTPTSLVALDTNESSLDGVEVESDRATFVRIAFPEIREIQFRHVCRRQYLGNKKAHDRRLSRQLLGREGARERNRIRSRLHDLTRSLVDQLAKHRAVLALEDLTGLPRPRGRSVKGGPRRAGSRSFRRRLSNWPQGELHRQLLYKAEDRGSRLSGSIPIVRPKSARDVVKFRNTEEGWGLGSTAGSVGGPWTAN
jgi:IS605 OrfB family transposase